MERLASLSPTSSPKLRRRGVPPALATVYAFSLPESSVLGCQSLILTCHEVSASSGGRPHEDDIDMLFTSGRFPRLSKERQGKGSLQIFPPLQRTRATTSPSPITISASHNSRIILELYRQQKLPAGLSSNKKKALHLLGYDQSTFGPARRFSDEHLLLSYVRL